MPKSKVGRPKGKFTQHRRLDRLREIMSKNPKGLSLYELSDVLGVTPRTMRRYFKELEQEHELEQLPTRGGGVILWRIRPREALRKLELRRTQAYALLAARRLFETMRGSTLYDEIDLVIDNLTRLAQRPGRGPNSGPADARLEQRFLYLPFAPKNYEGNTEALDDLFQCVSDLRPLSLLYKSAGRRSEERITIHPYAMVFHRDSVYCVGYHLARGEIRTFLLDRMRDTQCVYTERFALPDDFDIDQYFQGEFGIWKGQGRHKVIIDFDAKAAEYMRMRRVHKTQKLSSIPGGGVRLTMTVGNLTPVTNWVLEWGERATVIEPLELVRRVKAELRNALKNYG